MSSGTELSATKRALLLLEQMEAKVRAQEAQRTEPIAVVGIGCRFPSARGPEAFWRLLVEGRDAIREVPADRWPVDRFYDPDRDHAGTMTTRMGGFIDGVDRFDARFFGITPREAAALDPQQRLLLEACWEALEHGGLAPDRLRGSNTGVFLGLSGSDYARRVMGDPDQIDVFSGTGVAASVAAGRLSYLFDWHGPSLAIDTSCSSSLVALHQACQSLRSGECDRAVVAGANLILEPECSIYFSKVGALAADGRCKTFDARADGYARGEGVACVVLRRVSDALRDQDPITAVVLSTAVNHDGQSGGLTAPSGAAQRAVIERALEAARVAPEEIDLVEAHGTGTPLGDPIELNALNAVLSRGRNKDAPVWVGSVKTNFGHLEAAAGLAGLIKAALAIEHATIPAHLHFQEPTPHFDWSRSVLAVPVATQAWPVRGSRRLAGLSSFGFSGTNVHVILSSAPGETLTLTPTPTITPTSTGDGTAELLVLSARTETALEANSRAIARALERHPAPSLADVAQTLALGRSQLPVRRSLVVKTIAEAVDRLVAPATRRAPAKPPRIAFLLSGQGAQQPGMAKALFETEPIVRAVIERAPAPVQRALLDPTADDIHETALAQPALFVLSVALAELWASIGVRPIALLGHSVGELAALVIGGAVEFDPALAWVIERGRLMQSLPKIGAMSALFAPKAEVEALIAGREEVLAIAALNGPSHVVISGQQDAISEIERAAEAQDLEFRRLKVSHAFHSPLLRPILGALESAAAGLTLRPSTIPVISNVSGAPFGPDRRVDARALVEHAAAPVQFHSGLTSLAALGADLFLELGPGSTLADLARSALGLDRARCVPSLPRASTRGEGLWPAIGAVFEAGARIDFEALFRRRGGRRIHLPTYHFDETPAGLPPLPRPGREPGEPGPPAEAPGAGRLPANALVDVLD
ncbi:MAG: type I polyketide synthase [Deltaproteobacteria bacterium]|nr:type I polyketide synthase [Deltaproteobacteria bacterium]